MATITGPRSGSILTIIGTYTRREWRDSWLRSAVTVPESHAVIEWNKRRDTWNSSASTAGTPMHGIRAGYRRSEAIIEEARRLRREAVFAIARATVGNVRMHDEHDPEL